MDRGRRSYHLKDLVPNEYISEVVVNRFFTLSGGRFLEYILVIKYRLQIKYDPKQVQL